MITFESCPVCGSDSLEKFDRVGTAPLVPIEIMPGVKVNGAVITDYSVCQNCHLIFQNPRLSDSDLDKYYSDGYYRRLNNMNRETVDRDEDMRARTDEKLIRKVVGNVERHLDIGCSRGFLLGAIDAKQKVGVESDFGYVDVSGIEIYSEIDRVPYKRFDLVTAIHVLEHVPSPLDFLKKAAKFVGKNGYVVIEVPSWNSPGGPLRFAHLYHFEPGVLKQMCEQAGLRIIQEELTPHLMLICKKG